MRLSVGRTQGSRKYCASASILRDEKTLLREPYKRRYTISTTLSEGST